MLSGAREVISWKSSFRKLSEEYETAKKKKQALDGLLDTGKISQSTHDLFNTEIAEAVTDIEKQQKALLQKMDAKMCELEEQIKTLEILLANFEIQHVTGEVDEEVYQREINVISIGLETSRQELEAIRSATDQLLGGNVSIRQPTESVEAAEKQAKPTMEYVEVHETQATENQQEKPEVAAESKPAEPACEHEEKQGA